MTKVCTHGRKCDVAMQMLADSLRRSQTDHLDLWQIHEVVYDNDPDLCFAPAAQMNALEQHVAAIARDGRLELNKSTKVFDDTVGREQYGFLGPSVLPA